MRRWRRRWWNRRCWFIFPSRRRKILLVVRIRNVNDSDSDDLIIAAFLTEGKTTGSPYISEKAGKRICWQASWRNPPLEWTSPQRRFPLCC